MINNEYNFIFLHIPRTGGTSIESMFVEGAEHGAQKPLRGKHASPRYFRKRKKKKWDTYFKFTFVRNPWDRMVSAYEWAKAVPGHPHHTKGPFKDWIFNFPEKERKSNLLYPQTRWARTDTLDFIGYYESLSDDWKEVCRRLKLPQIYHRLPEVHKIPRPHYSAYYDEETRDKVHEYYSQEIELFNYSFEEQ